MNELLEKFNDTSAQSSFEAKDAQKNMGIVAVCYFLSFLFFVPIAMDSSSNYNRFHANQILTVFLAEVAVSIVCAILGLIPVLGTIIGILAGAAVLVVVIFLIIGVTKGMAVRVPFIGELIKLF